MRKIVLVGCFVSALVIVLASFSGVVGAKEIQDSILERASIIEDKSGWYPGFFIELIFKFFIALYLILAILWDLINPDD